MEKNRTNKMQFKNFVWIDIQNPDRENLDKIAIEYELDYFQIIDSLQPGHLPKFEKEDNYNFLILRAFTTDFDQVATSISELSNKIAFFYNAEKLITIHKAEFDFLKESKKEIKHTEELLLFIINNMVETYQPPLSRIDEKTTQIEESIFLHEYSIVSIRDLYYLKAQTRITKKLLQLFQNVIDGIEVSPQSRTALQDIKDSLINLNLLFDENLENAHNLLSTYLSINAQKNNNVMKLLTIFSAFFLPLTFIAGIYGMNFENMPELKWKNGYFYALGVMAIIAVIIYIWFKRKKIL